MKRIFDLVVATIVLIIFALPMLAVALLVRLTSKGPALHWSKRVGLHNQIFLMPKFRSMRTDAPQVATHLITNPAALLTPVGSFIRKTSLDELPQVFSVLKGDMSLVGPRPALFNQDDLIQLRTEKKVHTLKPGITGWAQVNGRDELPIPVKVEFDEWYLKNSNLIVDLKIILMTAAKVFKSSGVSH